MFIKLRDPCKRVIIVDTDKIGHLEDYSSGTLIKFRDQTERIVRETIQDIFNEVNHKKES